MSEELPLYATSSVLYAPLQLSEEQILQAYYDTFTHEPGYTVLRSLYDGILQAQLDGIPDLGRVQVYQAIVQNIRAWELRQEVRAHTHGDQS